METTRTPNNLNPLACRSIGLGYVIRPGYLLTSYIHNWEATLTAKVRLLTGTRIWLDPYTLFVANAALNYALIALHEFSPSEVVNALTDCPTLTQFTGLSPVSVITNLPTPAPFPPFNTWIETTVSDLKTRKTRLLTERSFIPHDNREDPAYVLFEQSRDDEAYPRLNKISQAGEPKAQCYMALACEHGRGGAPHSRVLAHQIFSAAAHTLSQMHRKNNVPDSLSELVREGLERTCPIVDDSPPSPFDWL